MAVGEAAATAALVGVTRAVGVAVVLPMVGVAAAVVGVAAAESGKMWGVMWRVSANRIFSVRFVSEMICKLRRNRFRRLPVYMYSGRGKFMPLPLKSKILETPGSLVTDDIKMFPL